MNTITLTTPIQTLDKILAINLNISLWTARTKLTADDLGGAVLPPEDLASLGSKKICDPDKLKIFSAIKARAFKLLDRNGVRFLSGWAIPDEKASMVIDGLNKLREEFYREKDSFLQNYDSAIAAWINAHPSWEKIIAGSIVGIDYIKTRMSFGWQLFKVSPAQDDTQNPMINSGLPDEVKNLGNTLFSEIAKDANEIWTKVLEGKTEVTHKALSPLRTMKEKLSGLSFIDPHVVPVVNMLGMVLDKMPVKGYISGASLLMVQGVVSMLKDTQALLAQTAAFMTCTPENSISAFLDNFKQDDGAAIPMEPIHKRHVASLGLW